VPKKSQAEIDAAIGRGLFRRWLREMRADRAAWERQYTIGISRRNAEVIAELTDGEVSIDDWPHVLPELHLERALHNRSRKSRVNGMQDVHRVAHSKGMKSRDAFLRAIHKVRTDAAPHGNSLRSLAEALDISPASLSQHRLPKKDPNHRPCPEARALRIQDLTGWPADAAHWPAGIS
jgi:hypothetical protein